MDEYHFGRAFTGGAFTVGVSRSSCTTVEMAVLLPFRMSVLKEKGCALVVPSVRRFFDAPHFLRSTTGFASVSTADLRGDLPPSPGAGGDGPANGDSGRTKPKGARESSHGPDAALGLARRAACRLGPGGPE